MNAERNEDVFQEPDVVPRALLLRIVAGTIAFGLSLCVIALLLLRAREYSLRPAPELSGSSLPAPHTVAGVREELFTVTHPRPPPLEQQRRVLEQYGWVDRGKGLIHVPITVGMELVLRDAGAGSARP